VKPHRLPAARAVDAIVLRIRKPAAQAIATASTGAQPFPARPSRSGETQSLGRGRDGPYQSGVNRRSDPDSKVSYLHSVLPCGYDRRYIRDEFGKLEFQKRIIDLPSAQ
jgi:hypothetical protein